MGFINHIGKNWQLWYEVNYANDSKNETAKLYQNNGQLDEEVNYPLTD